MKHPRRLVIREAVRRDRHQQQRLFRQIRHPAGQRQLVIARVAEVDRGENRAAVQLRRVGDADDVEVDRRHQQHRRRGVAQHGFTARTEQQLRQAAMPARSDHHEPRIVLRRLAADDLGNVTGAARPPRFDRHRFRTVQCACRNRSHVPVPRWIGRRRRAAPSTARTAGARTRRRAAARAHWKDRDQLPR